MRFRTTLEQAGKTATGIEVPADVVESLGSGRRPAVHVTINSHTYRSTVAVMGGRFMVSVSATNRELAHVRAGDELDVDIELDTEPRVVEVPADLSEALDRDQAAKRAFEKLSYSGQLRHVLAIDAAKTQETRQRRIDTALTMLAGDQPG
jgi:Bacteriocin-protection, YdeI or OmpD-Associated/Domain of unknown function (DUF1905)